MPAQPSAATDGPKNLHDAYVSLGLSPDRRPGHVVNRRRGQVMLHLGELDASFHVHPIGIWSDGTRIKVLVTDGEFHAEISPSSEYQLTGGIAHVFDALIHISRRSLERIEDVERALAELERDPLHAPPLRVLELKRRVADVREELGRAITAVADVSDGRIFPLSDAPVKALHVVEGELLRLRDLTQATQSALSDIFIIRQTDQANQLQVVANRMSSVSNRIAELANISNIRMLGLAYVTLILAVVSSIILFPNTAATIFGMATVYHAPDWLIFFTLVATTVIPAYYFFSQKWIRELFRGMRRYEARVEEGFLELTEHVPGADEGPLPVEGGAVAVPAGAPAFRKVPRAPPRAGEK